MTRLTHSVFPETRWTLMAELATPEVSEQAIEKLLQMYWAPIYAFLRRTYSIADAEDLTQEFLLNLVDGELLRRADQVDGKLRSWLLKALGFFLANKRRAEKTIKRGGLVTIFPLDNAVIRQEIETLVTKAATPAEAFDRAWLGTLIRLALDSLRQQYTSVGQLTQFEALLPWLLEGEDASQVEAAAHLGLSISNFRVKLHRLRGRYRDELLKGIKATVSTQAEAEEEVLHIRKILGKTA